MPTPVTTPVEEPIVATDGSLLLQLPPDVPDDSVALLPTQIVVVPPMAAGAARTVRKVWDTQEPTVYLRVVPPPIKELSTPVEVFIVPTLVLLLLHVPPAGAPVAVCVTPTHTGFVTLMVGVGLTDISRVT